MSLSKFLLENMAEDNNEPFPIIFCPTARVIDYLMTHKQRIPNQEQYKLELVKLSDINGDI